MIELTINLEQIEATIKRLRGVVKSARLATFDVAKTLRTLVAGRTPVKTGALKRAWTPVQRTGNGYSFSNPTAYGPVLESGLYKSVGPRTIAAGDGIYSRQAPGGMIAPIVEDEALIQRVVQGVLDQMAEGDS